MTTDSPKSRGAGCMSTVLTLVVLLLLLVGCGSERGHSAQPRKDAGQAQKHVDPGNAQPAPVQADPSAHNTQPGMVGLFLTWESESRTTPVCEWSKNGASQPCANMEGPTHEGNTWVGLWEHEETARTGDVYTLNAQGTGAIKLITCEIAWKGQIIPGVTQRSRCSAKYQLN